MESGVLQEQFEFEYTKKCTSKQYLQKIPMQVNIHTAFDEPDK